MIEKNDYQLNINNGDIGCCIWQDNSWQIVFEDGRTVHINDLSDEKYTLAFAISIHKSQGSEYQHVDVVLGVADQENANPLITPYLLYTAVTRAKDTLTVYGDKILVEQALSQKDNKQSALQSLLTISNSEVSHEYHD